VAERAGDADTRELTQVIDRSLNADDGIQPQEFDGHRGVGQVDLSGLQRGDDFLRQGLDVHLEPYGQRRRRRDCRHDVVHLQHVGSQLLVTEGVVAKDRLPLSRLPIAIVSVASFALI
jgi:hypothetical protein